MAYQNRTMTRAELRQTLFSCGSCGHTYRGDQLHVHDVDPSRGAAAPKTIGDAALAAIGTFSYDALRCPCGSASPRILE